MQLEIRNDETNYWDKKMYHGRLDVEKEKVKSYVRNAKYRRPVRSKRITKNKVAQAYWDAWSGRSDKNGYRRRKRKPRTG